MGLRGEGEIRGEIGAIVRRARLSDDHTARRSRRLSIDERARNCDRRGARSTSGAITSEVSSSSLSLSNLGSLVSLSFSFSGNDLK